MTYQMQWSVGITGSIGVGGPVTKNVRLAYVQLCARLKREYRYAGLRVINRRRGRGSAVQSFDHAVNLFHFALDLAQPVQRVAVLFL